MFKFGGPEIPNTKPELEVFYVIEEPEGLPVSYTIIGFIVFVIAVVTTLITVLS